MNSALRSLTYVSRLTEPMDDTAVAALALEAARLNALDGITGVLAYNGRRFLQTIEGVAEAIDDLLGRLRRDPRHHNLIVCDSGAIDAPSFGSWDMHLVTLSDIQGAERHERVREYISRVDDDGLFWAT